MKRTNNINDYSKRTAANVKSILKSHDISCDVDNLGDNRTFDIMIDPTAENVETLQRCGFLVEHVKHNHVTVICY